jgi:hypothetical protein
MIAFTGYFFISKPGQILEGLSEKNFLGQINLPIKNPLKKTNAENFFYSYIQGDNLIHTSEKSYMSENNIDLKNNDEIFTGSNSFATLTFKNNSKLRVGEGTRLIIRNIPNRKPTGLYIFELSKGEIMMDFSDDSGKYAVKFQVDKYSIYTRKSTLYISKTNQGTKIAVDYGTAKVKNIQTENSTFLSSAQGLTISNDQISKAGNYKWVDKVNWDEYFHDLNRTGRKGPFKMKTTLLSKRNDLKTRKRNNKIGNLARSPSKTDNNKKNTRKKLDEAISNNGGALLEKLPFYGEKIKNIKDQINLNTDAMKDREKMLEGLD